MPTIAETIEVVITGKSQGFVQATRDADSAIGRLTTRMHSFQELGASLGERAAQGFELIKGSLEAAGEEQAALTRAVGNFKGAIPAEELEKWAVGLERVTGIPHGRIEEIAGELGALGANPEQAEALVGPILNVEQALKNTGKSAEGAASAIAVALKTGDASRLRRSGVVLDPRTQAQFEAAGLGAEGYARRLQILLPVLQQVGGTAAEDFRNTLPGATQAFNTSIESLKAAFAGPLVKPMTDLANAATNLANSFETADPTLKSIVAWASVGIVAAFGVASIAFKGLAFWQSYQIAKLIEATQETNKLKAATDRLAGSQGKAALAAEDEAVAESGAAGAAGKRKTGGGFFGAGGGVKGVLAQLGIEIGAQVAQQALGETDWSKQLKPAEDALRATKNVGFRGAQGAGFGAFAGQEGALVGGIVGGIVGSVEDILHGVGVLKPGAAKKTPEQEWADKLAAALDKNTAAAEKNTAVMSRGSVSTSEVALYRQLGARRVQQFGS